MCARELACPYQQYFTMYVSGTDPYISTLAIIILSCFFYSSCSTPWPITPKEPQHRQPSHNCTHHPQVVVMLANPTSTSGWDDARIQEPSPNFFFSPSPTYGAFQGHCVLLETTLHLLIESTAQSLAKFLHEGPEPSSRPTATQGRHKQRGTHKKIP